MANTKLRKAIRSDVMDELAFISAATDHYSCAQRQKASNLMHALYGTEWEPAEEIKKVVDIYEGHHIEIPKYPIRREKQGVN